ncbi:hypothetical protein GWK91_12690 [Virgibacillus sp. MSP4-1]|uniref:hypothetical protein n=1 Tax=Virgibacillus sp. MSP4-1 TaxID=2700081 RepID=UPI00039DEE66|nr:hypothetical protein [Virgibacillus sp. MSP4-1]QHS23753.1 hypothetical protein GWK91_12690 [Virgibacillus sp. MSP4-1]
MKKFLAAAISTIMLSIPLSNVAAASKSLAESESIQVSNSLERILEKDNVSKEELREYSKRARAELSGKPNLQWKLGAVKNAVKFVVDHHNLIPSKTIRGWVDKYGNKMMDALDTLESGTRIGLQLAFEEAGIPRNVAKAIADFIVTFIL